VSYKNSTDKYEDKEKTSNFPIVMFIQSLVFLLGLWGCLAIYNSNYLGDSPLFYVGRQLLWLVFGMVVMFLFQRLPFSMLRENAEFLALAAYIPLLAVLIFGVRINGMKGWYSLGFAYIQPSEFAKPFFVLTLCHFGTKMKPGFKRFIMLAAITLLWVIPVLLEPDVGSALIFVLAFAAVYWLLGGALWHLLILPLVGVPALAVLIRFNPYIIDRLTGFINPDLDPLGSGWHIRQFQFTLARGGALGAKMGKALWSNAYLPLSHSDSVFASIVESLGVLGAVPVLLLFAAIIYGFYKLALQAKNQYRSVFILGSAMVFALQALVHVSVNVTIFPPTGLTLPILSYGGSSMVSTLLAFGLMFSAASKYDTVPKTSE
jgi:cell division protein FtsW